MVLVTHGVVGSVIAKVFGLNPLSAFVFGFFSHFLLDSIPHWDYKLSSKNIGNNFLDTDMKIGRSFVLDIFKVGVDVLLGLIIVFLFFPTNSYVFLSVLCGFIGGIAPDFLQFVYFKFRKQPFILIQKFHHSMHSRKNLNNHSVVGVFSQIFIIALMIFIARIF